MMEKVGRWKGLAFVLGVYLLSRLFYLVSGALFAETLPPGDFHSATPDDPYGSMNTWSHWDGEHYTQLAREGYLRPPDGVSPAFFPLYSLLVRASAAAFGGPPSLAVLGVWGVVVSMLALPFALYFVYRLSEAELGTRAARAATLALAFFPASFFLNAVYTESLFLALSAGSLWAARVRRDLLLACLLAGLAAATRNVGIFLLVPLALEWYRNARTYRWRAVYLALAPSGLALYAAYLWRRFGNPLLFYAEQEDWNRSFAGPLDVAGNLYREVGEGFGLLLDSQPPPGESLESLLNRLSLAHDVYDLVLLVIAAALLVLGLRVLPLGLSAYTLLLVVPGALYGTPETPLMGMPRYLLVAFPLFMVAGWLLGKSRLALWTWVSLSAAASLVLCALFVSWRFVA